MSDEDAADKGTGATPPEPWFIPPPPPPPPIGSPLPPAGPSPPPAVQPGSFGAQAPAIRATQPPGGEAAPKDDTRQMPAETGPAAREPASIMEAQPAGETAAATEAPPAGETAARAEAPPAGETAARAEAPPAGEVASAAEAPPAVEGTVAIPEVPETTDAAEATEARTAPAEVPPNAASKPTGKPAGASAATSVLTEVRDQSLWDLGAAAILVGFALGWLGAILLSFRHLPGLTGRARILQFFQPAAVSWSLASLVAVTLFALGRKFEPSSSRESRLVDVLPLGLVLAGAAVMVSAAIGVLVELTNFGNGIDLAFSGLISYAGTFIIGTATTWWAYWELHRQREARKAATRRASHP